MKKETQQKLRAVVKSDSAKMSRLSFLKGNAGKLSQLFGKNAVRSVLDKQLASERETRDRLAVAKLALAASSLAAADSDTCATRLVAEFKFGLIGAQPRYLSGNLSKIFPSLTSGDIEDVANDMRRLGISLKEGKLGGNSPALNKKFKIMRDFVEMRS